jgi:hypothetical protein
MHIFSYTRHLVSNVTWQQGLDCRQDSWQHLSSSQRAEELQVSPIHLSSQYIVG